jgi:hypothetical protein
MSSIFPSSIATAVFQIVILLWILSEIVGTVIIPRIRRRGTVIQKKDRGSTLLIFITLFVSIGLANYFATTNIAMLPGFFIQA